MQNMCCLSQWVKKNTSSVTDSTKPKVPPLAFLGDASFAQEVEAFVGKFSKLSGIVLKLTKEAALSGLSDDMDQGLKVIEKIYLDKSMKNHDAMEGLEAFLEKRKPTWKDN
jgi:enoyl-CoA hydratase/carnithine racemase